MRKRPMPEERGRVTWGQEAGAPTPARQDWRTVRVIPGLVLPSVLLHFPRPGRPHLDPPYLHPGGGDVEGAFDLGTQFGHGDEPSGGSGREQGLRSWEHPGLQGLLFQSSPESAQQCLDVRARRPGGGEEAWFPPLQALTSQGRSPS